MTHDNKPQLIELFTNLNDVSSIIQYEMGKSILEKPEYQKQFKAQLKWDEERTMQYLQHHMFQYIKTFALAHKHRGSMLCGPFKLHSDLTGDPFMQDVIEEVNRRVHNKDS